MEWIIGIPAFIIGMLAGFIFCCMVVAGKEDK